MSVQDGDSIRTDRGVLIKMDCEMSPVRSEEDNISSPYTQTKEWSEEEPISEAETIREQYKSRNYNPDYDGSYNKGYQSESKDVPLAFSSKNYSDHVNSYSVDGITSLDDGTSSEDSVKTCFTVSSKSNDQDSEVSQIRDWAKANNVPPPQVDDLLQILRQRILKNAPSTAEELFNTSDSATTRGYSTTENKLSEKRKLLTNEQDFKAFIISKISQISSDIADLKRIYYSQDRRNFLKFLKKHNLNVPLNTEIEFEHLNLQIVVNEDFHSELCDFLKIIVSKNVKILPNLINILRTFLSQELLEIYSASKFLFTQTAFAQSIKYIILDHCQNLEVFASDSEVWSKMHKALDISRNWGKKCENEVSAPQPIKTKAIGNVDEKILTSDSNPQYNATYNHRNNNNLDAMSTGYTTVKSQFSQYTSPPLQSIPLSISMPTYPLL